MRFLHRGQAVAQTALKRESSAVLGEYSVRLVGIEKWSKLIFVDISGMPMIFAGFGIIILGGLIQYMTPPRELIGICQSDKRYQVFWRGVAFVDFYHEERDKLAMELNREKG
jgi:hypothetical protein